MRIGILTGGGDSSGINAGIRAVVRRGIAEGDEIMGIRNGWLGLLEGDIFEVKAADVSGILPRGGTILGTSRTNPFKIEGGVERIAATAHASRLEAIVAIGGDDTLGVCHKINGLPQPIHGVGIPQTIDNDIEGTDFAIGFDSAVAVATDACDKLHSTAESHHRIMVLEVMGRDSGHVALEAGIAGGADIILVPEEPFHIEDVASRVKDRLTRGKLFSIVVVAEGASPVGTEQVSRGETRDAFGHVMLGGIGEHVASELQRHTGVEARVTVLGHLQRGGYASPLDRLLATRFGVAAVDLLHQGAWDRMVAIRGREITDVPLETALNRHKPIDKSLYEMAKLFY